MNHVNQEWKRTRPDLVVFLPKEDQGADSSNQHLNVVATPSGSFLGTWTSATRESAPNQKVLYTRSTDRGKTWSEPQVLDGPLEEDPPGTGLASWQFLIVAPNVPEADKCRIWCFYVKNVGIDDARTADTGVLRARYSDDEGETWSTNTFDFPIAPNALGHPDPAVPPTWIVYQNPTVTPERHVLAGFTRWGSNALDPGVNMFERISEVSFLRFENILSEADPQKLIITTWPKAEHGLRVSNPYRPGISTVQEPTVQAFSDGRLICVMRTLHGRIYFALSEDDGRTWDEPRPLCYSPGGTPILHPMAPCPLYKLKDGRFLLLFYNNDGSIHGGSGPLDSPNVRNPGYITIGREVPGHRQQPIRFGHPKVFADTDWTPVYEGGRATQPFSYCSLVEDNGERILFYPDRKHFLLGRYLTDQWLQECDPNSQRSQ